MASMRPQRNAAENVKIVTFMLLVTSASMRPQRNAAENDYPAKNNLHDTHRFNEAAA